MQISLDSLFEAATEAFLNAYFAFGWLLVAAVVLALALGALWVGRKNRFFLPRRWWQLALDAGLLAVLALSLWASYFAGRIERALTDRVAALDLHLISSGAARRLADYQGKIVVLNFWATWCSPCREEMPGLNRLAEAHRSDVVVLTVTDEPVEDVRRYEEETTPLVTEIATFQDERPPAGPFAALAYRARPTTVLFDRSGAIRELLIGAQSYASLERAVRHRL